MTANLDSAERPKALERLSQKLFAKEAERQAFLAAILGGASERPVVVLPYGIEITSAAEAQLEGHPAFQPEWVVGREEARALGAHEAGYQLDLSSVFMASPLFFLSVEKGAWRILDLCSSPGGKTILASRILEPEHIGCNEVIQKRIPALISNLKRCGVRNVQVYSRDPEFFALRSPAAFDLVLVDAPCSGQSLFGSSEAPSGVFHQTIVTKNSLRQRRILAEAGKIVRPGGYILYMTCTFSLEENERVLEWFLKKNPDFESVEIAQLAEFASKLTNAPAYRLFPEQGFGRGGFTALLRNSREGERGSLESLQAIWRQDDSPSGAQTNRSSR